MLDLGVIVTALELGEERWVHPCMEDRPTGMKGGSPQFTWTHTLKHLGLTKNEKEPLFGLVSNMEIVKSCVLN